jgi:ABC-type uncharacterized transport system YnjBCD ATPase subunit
MRKHARRKAAHASPASSDLRTIASDHVGTVTQASRATAAKMAAINVPRMLVIASPLSRLIRVRGHGRCQKLLGRNSITL